METIVYSKLTTFPQAGYAEVEDNHNRTDDIVGTSWRKIYTAGENKPYAATIYFVEGKYPRKDTGGGSICWSNIIVNSGWTVTVI